MTTITGRAHLNTAATAAPHKQINFTLKTLTLILETVALLFLIMLQNLEPHIESSVFRCSAVVLCVITAMVSNFLKEKSNGVTLPHLQIGLSIQAGGGDVTGAVRTI